MRKNKGFTLVELLAMLVVLGILLGVAIPNIVGMVANQRANSYKNDATNMMTLAKNQIAKLEQNEKPGEGECYIYTLKYLQNYTSELETGPNGHVYLTYESFVIYARKNNEYKYYIRLLETITDETKGTGLQLVDYNTLDNFDKSYIKTVAKYGFSDNATDSMNLIKNNTAVQSVKTKCGTVTKYYK